MNKNRSEIVAIRKLKRYLCGIRRCIDYGGYCDKEAILFKSDYDCVMEKIKSIIECDDFSDAHSNKYSKEEKLDLLKFYSDIIRNDIVVSYSAYFLYVEFEEASSLVAPPFPYTSNYILRIDEVSFNDVTLLGKPRVENKLSELLKILKKEDYKKNQNDTAEYFPRMKLLVVYDGVHSGTIAKYFNKGAITAKIIDEEKMYQDLSSDSENWWYKNKKTLPVSDFRFSLLYEINKAIYEYENQEQ